MKTTLTIILILIVLFLIAEPTIQFKPFRITFESIGKAIGLILFVVAMAFYQVPYGKQRYIDGYKEGRIEGYKKGLKKGAEIEHESAIEVAKQIIQESKQQQ